MTTFSTDYIAARDYAVTEACKLKCVMQLRAGKEYNKSGFFVSVAVQDAKLRFGTDAEGEFISPTDPR